MKQTNELCESKTILAFDIMVFEGKICGGCEMIRDLIAEVPFTDEEIAQMRQLDYSILEGSDMEAYPDYTCDIPVDFLPED